MKRIISLIKACMTDNMSIFKIKSNKGSKLFKIILPILLSFTCMFYIFSYANMIIKPLSIIHLEYVLLSIFILFTFILTLIEGVYKSSSLLFNCKDEKTAVDYFMSSFIVGMQPAEKGLRPVRDSRS